MVDKFKSWAMCSSCSCQLKKLEKNHSKLRSVSPPRTARDPITKVSIEHETDRCEPFSTVYFTRLSTITHKSTTSKERTQAMANQLLEMWQEGSYK
eukprot:5318558-Amphidinium_carterae.1